MLISGSFSYYLIQTPVHEFGHFTFAYAFNKTAIANFSFPLKEAFTTIDPFVSLHPSLNYKYPMIESFSIPQVFVISFAGYLFELVYFVVLIVVLDKLLKKEIKSMKRFYLISIIMGFYIMSFNIFIAWFDITNPNADVYKVILTFPSMYAGLAFALIVDSVTAFLYIKFLKKFSQSYFTKLNKIIPFVKTSFYK
jgi:magnesium-transporting ATPase (P-type)